MGSGRRGPSLAERSGSAGKARTPAGACHCWVIGSSGVRYPGLLLEWRRRDDRWQGLVAYLRVEEPAGCSMVQGWLDADRLHSTGRNP